jgi:hypothetical protein
MAATFIKETMSHRVLLGASAVCPFVRLLRHRSLTVRVFIGKIPVPMMEGKGNDWLMDSVSPLPPSKLFPGTCRAAETNVNFVPPLRNPGIPILERVGRLTSG